MNKKNAKVITPQGNFRKLILHFNIDKTIVMRDSLGYNNADFMIRVILSEMIWGKSDLNKKGEEYFKVESKNLEFTKPQTEDDSIVSYSDYLEQKFKILNEEEFNALEPKPEKTLEEYNKEMTSSKIRELCDIVEQNHPGAKFKRMFEDMRKKLRVDEKIQTDFGLKLDNSKLDEKVLNEVITPKFNQLGDDYDRKEKFRRIFKNSYHKIIISFFTMIINLKKVKQDFAIVFRFFGHEESEIEEVMYEYNCFCNCLHPRYCGDYGYNKVKFDVEKEKKNYMIDLKTMEYMGAIFRNEDPNEESMVFGTKYYPETLEEVENVRGNLAGYYNIIKDGNENQNNNVSQANNNNNSNSNPESYHAPPPTIFKGYNSIYLNFMSKLTQNCAISLMDDYSFFKNHESKHGKLYLIDPYDTETLQIFFDTDLNANPEKIDIIDVVTKQKIPKDSLLNTFVVNVEPFKAIVDSNYFSHKIEECINNRKLEIQNMMGERKDVEIEEKNYHQELNSLDGMDYLNLTVIPLLQNAMNMCEILRPSDPVAFIGNFMLLNKKTMKTADQIGKELYDKNEGINNQPEKGDSNNAIRNELDNNNITISSNLGVEGEEQRKNIGIVESQPEIIFPENVAGN